MKNANKTKITTVLRYFARTLMLIFALALFVFALLSGSCSCHGTTTMTGIIRNSPNALPWLFLLVFWGIAWKKELIGGLLIIFFGLSATIFFRFYREPVLFYIIALPPMILGSCFLLSWWLRREK